MARPRQPKLGQHFLVDAGFRRRIAQTLDIRPADLLIEIGAGRGAMTGLVAERARRVVAVELDGALAEKLRRDVATIPQLEVLEADILSVDLGELCRRHGVKLCSVFGNLPYYVTSPILHHLFRSARFIRSMGLVMQYEMARRVTARPGGRSARDYGYLSVLAQLESKPSLRFSIPPGAFAPPPKVRSALVTLEMSPRFPDWTGGERERFLEFVGRCFAQKRKTLANNLIGAYSRARVERALAALRVVPSARAEQLTLEQFRDLQHNVEPSTAHD